MVSRSSSPGRARPEFSTHPRTDNINGVFSDTYVFGPTRFNEFRLGYNRRSFSVVSLSYGQDWAKQLGMPNVSPLTFPVFNIGYGWLLWAARVRSGEDLSVQDNFHPDHREAHNQDGL